MTRRFLEAAATVRGLRLGITTKGAVILRDIDLLRRIHERSALSIHVSLISLDADLLRRLEPLAPPPAVRLEVMRRLAAAGLLVGLSVSPVLPALTDDEAGLEALVAAAARAGSSAWPRNSSSCARPPRRSTCAGSRTSSRATSRRTGTPTTARCTSAGAIASGCAR